MSRTFLEFRPVPNLGDFKLYTEARRIHIYNPDGKREVIVRNRGEANVFFSKLRKKLHNQAVAKYECDLLPQLESFGLKDRTVELLDIEQAYRQKIPTTILALLAAYYIAMLSKKTKSVTWKMINWTLLQLIKDGDEDYQTVQDLLERYRVPRLVHNARNNLLHCTSVRQPALAQRPASNNLDDLTTVRNVISTRRTGNKSTLTSKTSKAVRIKNLLTL